MAAMFKKIALSALLVVLAFVAMGYQLKVVAASNTVAPLTVSRPIIISGRVIYKSGTWIQPVKNAKVKVVSRQNNRAVVTNTDKTGFYKVNTGMVSDVYEVSVTDSKGTVFTPKPAIVSGEFNIFNLNFIGIIK